MTWWTMREEGDMVDHEGEGDMVDHEGEGGMWTMRER